MYTLWIQHSPFDSWLLRVSHNELKIASTTLGLMIENTVKTMHSI